MRVAVISDIHGNIFALEKVLAEIETADEVWVIGDLVGYYPHATAVIERIIDLAPARIIQGNHEKYVLGELPVPPKKRMTYSLDFTRNQLSASHLKWLGALPESQDFKINGKHCGLFHGSPWNIFTDYIYPDYPCFGKFASLPFDIVIMGQTHYPMIKKVDGKTLLNPGSVGQPRDRDCRASFAWLDTQSWNMENVRVDYPVGQVCASVKAHNLSPELCDILKRT